MTAGKEFDDSIKSMVLEIRKARSGMVQVDQQYRLIYDVMDYYKKHHMPTDVSAVSHLKDSVSWKYSRGGGVSKSMQPKFGITIDSMIQLLLSKNI